MADIDTENLSNDVAELRQLLESVLSQNAALNEKVAKLIVSHNEVGQNIAWLVANTQGLFQMMQNPEFMNQIMSSVLGGKMPSMGGANDGG